MTETASRQVDVRLAPARYDEDAEGDGLPPVADPPSQILLDALWLGGSPVEYAWAREQGINVVADLSDADAYPDPEDIADLAYIKHPLVDGDLPDVVVLDGLVATLADAIRAGRRVLVHCGWGRNRSGLVAVLVVRELLRVDGAAALRLVRRRRYRAVNNEAFAAYLATLPPPE